MGYIIILFICTAAVCNIYILCLKQYIGIWCGKLDKFDNSKEYKYFNTLYTRAHNNNSMKVEYLNVKCVFWYNISVQKRI